MEVKKILRAGYFDTLKIDGQLKPINNSKGTVILPNYSFKDALNNSEDAFKHGVASLRINLIGECNSFGSFFKRESMQEDREKAGLVRVPSSSNLDVYMVGYVDVLIVKSDYAIPFEVDAKGKTEKDMERLAKTNDCLEMYLAALGVSKHIVEKHKYSTDYINIAIIDKVYIYPLFRRCKISTWLHNNIADIINMYSLVFPTGIILTFGDFTQESNNQFNMSTAQYNKMLERHYKKLGYFNINKLGINGVSTSSNIMYKLLV